MSVVIRHNFDIENRGAVRRLRTQLKLGALHEANIRVNPLPYLERASEHIYQIEKVLFEAVNTATSPTAPSGKDEMVSISKAEWQRYLACLAIIKNGLAQLVAGDEDDQK
jgi:hypothetical protein